MSEEISCWPGDVEKPWFFWLGFALHRRIMGRNERSTKLQIKTGIALEEAAVWGQGRASLQASS